MTDERAAGRNVQESVRLRARLQALDESLTLGLHNVDRRPTDEFGLRGLAFTAEAYAWAILQYARAVIFEERLGLPSSDNDVFGVFVQAGRIDVAQARKLKQFCELRHLASRDLEKIDFREIVETIRARDEIRELSGKISAV